jgi:hypothetical protein
MGWLLRRGDAFEGNGRLPFTSASNRDSPGLGGSQGGRSVALAKVRIFPAHENSTATSFVNLGEAAGTEGSSVYA